MNRLHYYSVALLPTLQASIGVTPPSVTEKRSRSNL